MTLFIRLLAILLTFVSINTDAFSQNKKINTEWLFIYYMPYDNNLSEYGQKIIQMVKSNITSNKVIATFQTDYAEDNGLTRHIITNNITIKDTLSNENSADTKSYQDYLLWVKKKVSFKKLSIIFLNHGGRLDELCLDEKPNEKYLKIDSVKIILDKIFGKNSIDLLFLQVCNKGSIEPLFEFRNVAKYTLCSQLELGAPNYYYSKLFYNLSHDNYLNGVDIAKIIVDNDSYDMYGSYTLIDNSKVNKFYKYLLNFFKIINKTKDIKLKKRPKGIYYMGESYWDIVSLLNSFDLNNNSIAYQKRKLTINYITKQLIVFHKINPFETYMKAYSGLSIFNYSQNSNAYHNLHLYKSIFPICRNLPL